MNKLLLTFLLILAIQPQLLRGQEQQSRVTKALLLYKKGAYLQAVKHLDQIQGQGALAIQGTVDYWKALCYSRLQEFDKAVEHFEKSLKSRAYLNKAVPTDLHYEYGQALYASNDLRKAREAFALSARKNYMRASSLYYMGFISQTLEQYPTAIKYYRRIPRSETDVAQAASMQLGEIILVQAKERNNTRALIQKYVLPQWELAIKIASESTISADIKKRMAQIKEEYDLDENKMINGRRIPEKRTNLRFTENFVYDTNVITEASLAPIKATPENKASWISKSQLNLSHTFTFKRRYVITPELKLTYDHYLRRNAPAIHKNDNTTIVPKVEGKLEHFFLKKMATFSADLEYSYQEKDVNQNKDLIFYGRTLTLTVGEKVKFLSIGETTLKLKLKQFTGRTETLDSDTNGISLTQNFAFANQHLLLALASADFTKLPKDDASSSDSYTFRLDYIVPNFHGYRPSAALSYTLMDTKKQKATRGTEKTFAPSLAVARTFLGNVDVSLKYDYTRNVSLSKATYDYTKHVYGLEAQVKF